MFRKEKLIPYNQFWMDCVKNNLMSILIDYSHSFSNLPLTFSAEYWKKIMNQKFPSQENYQSLLEQGLFLPKINYNSEVLYSYFHINEKLIHYSELDKVHEIIGDALSRQRYVFIHVDRFFYPAGREAKRIHFVHPTFIYGLSDQGKSYEALEDCLSPGHMHHFQIPFDVLFESTKYLLESQQNVQIGIVSLNEEKINNGEVAFSQSTLLDTWHCLSADKMVYLKEYDLYYQVGIRALEEYFDKVEYILSAMNDESLFALRTNSFIQFHKRNELLFKNLHLTGTHHHSSLLELSELSNDLSTQWDIYKLLVLKRFQTNKDKDMPLIKEQLMQIISLEKDIIRKMGIIIESVKLPARATDSQ